MDQPTQIEVGISAASPGERSDQISGNRPDPAEGCYPLSYNQQSLWFVEKLAPGSAVYNLVVAVRLHAAIDVDAFHRAFQQLVARHAAWHTIFPVSNGVPVQQVLPTPEFAFRVEDASGWEQAAVDSLLSNELRRPFDLEHGPLMRITLLQRRPEEWLLVLTLHHLVTDMWSMAIILAEATQLYRSELLGTPCELRTPRVEYGDYARWQLKAMAGPEGERHWQYWRQELAGELPVLDLPTDRPRPAVYESSGAAEPFVVPADVTSGLRQLAKANSASLHALLLAAYQVLLHRYSGQEELLLGFNTAGRSARTARTVGYFVNPMVVRASLVGDPTFLEVLEQVDRTIKDSVRHASYPFARLIERLQPERDPAHSPLVQAMFSWQKTTQLVDPIGLAFFGTGVASGTTEMAGLVIEPVALLQHSGFFDLSLLMGDVEEEFVGNLLYRTDLFEAATIRRMVGHFQVLLRGIVADPACSIATLPLLPAEEKPQITHGWCETGVEDPEGEPVHRLIEAQAQRTPEAVALEFGEQRLRYAQLDQQAEKLAGRLRALGVSRNTTVGILLPRTAKMVVALLAVWKAGGVPVPLDPGYPTERLRFMVEDTGLAMLVTLGTQPGVKEILDGLAGRQPQVLYLDRPWNGDRGRGEDGQARMADLAYIIHTSGSTGRPKGVAVSHGNLLSFLRAMRAALRLGPQDKVLSVTPLSFDPVMQDLFLPLILGACVVLASEEEAHDGRLLGARLAKSGATVMQATPTTWRLLLEAGWPGNQGLRILSGGETLGLVLARELLARCGELWNVYGPTETTVWCTAERIAASVDRITIGRPLGNTQAYVLDAQLQPVPVGVVGELYIGGAGVAQGYHGQPELTAECFLPDPFASEAGGRLYRTGDMARFLPDGRLQYLGRRDQQVKIRGFRVELGEIESWLNSHSQVGQAVVVADTDPLGQPRLVAYVTSPGNGAPGAGELRSILRARLPDYMVPSAFVHLEALPLTPSGKVDRRALPAVDGNRMVDDSGPAVPRTPLAQMIAKIWSQLLGVDPASNDDDFFELGGHSLLATQVVSRLRDGLGVELSLQEFFAAPTIAGLAAAVEQTRRRGQGLAEARVSPVPRDQPLPLTFSQERMWIVQQIQPGTTAYNIPLAIRLRGSLDVATLEQTLNELIRRHEILRTTIVIDNGQPRQRIDPAIPLQLTITDLRRYPADEREALILDLCRAHATESFDLAAGPLLRAALFRLGDKDHVLQVTMHHAVADAWSLAVAMQEVQSLYSAFAAGEPSPLPEPEIQYADFACWQRDWLQSGALEPQLAYWMQQLAGVSVLALPTDRPRPAVQTSAGSQRLLSLDAALLEDLTDLGHQEKATLFMTLLAAFQVLLHRYSGQGDIAVGVPVANRHWPGSERLLGTLVNTVVMRTAVDGNHTFRELLRQVRQVALDAYTHQDFPFEQLVTALAPRRDLSQSPLFRVMFNVTNVPMPELELPGLTWTVVETDRGAAQFDLSLSLIDMAGFRRLAAEYNTDLFDDATIERFLGHFQVLLEGIVANPDQPIAQLPLFTQAQEQQVLVEWNATRVDYPRDACLHQLFQAQAARTPGAVAVEYQGKKLSYSQLNRQADRLAAQLRARGVPPDVPVGICLPRGPDMVVALLAVLKAGAAYVPLDLTFPLERLCFMVADSRMPVLLTLQSLPLARRLQERLPTSPLQMLYLDNPWEKTAAKQPAGPAVGPENLAYIIYTSGSTGQPKGVEVTHRNLVNFLVAMADRPGLSARDRLLAVTTLSFDIAALEVFGPLLVGARVIMASEEDARDGRHLIQSLQETGATVMQATPATWRMLIEAGWHGSPGLKILCGGEVLPPDLAADLLQRSSTLWNMYGPTETTVWSLISLVQSAQGPIPIGRPIANTQAYVLDNHLQPVPVGVVGELFIGGDGVSRGYRNRPDLTASAFLPDPFRSHPRARLYRTGDLARFLPDGSLEWLGRRDLQVKVRGFRIELAEIEAVLSGHLGVHSVAATTHPNGQGSSQLVSYIVPDRSPANPPPTAEALRLHARTHLPDYMVPTHFVFLDSLPLTPNGKIDRPALPAPEEVRAQVQMDSVAPRNDVEARLQRIWQAVLAVQPIGVTDDFFELGGHSLLAVRLFTRIEGEFSVRLPLSALFRESTIEHLAALITKESASATPASLVPLQPDGDRPPVFCIHGITGDVLWFADLASHLAPDIPFYGLESRALTETEKAASDIPTLATQYVADIRHVQPHGPYYLAGASFGGAVALEMARQLQAQGEPVALLAIFDHEPPGAGGEGATPAGSAPLDTLQHFLRNFPHWLASLRNLTGKQFLARIRRRIALMQRLKAASGAVSQEVPLQEIVDYADQLPQHRQRLIQTHYQALRDYRPQPYQGRISLFKASIRPLFGPYYPEVGWARLAGEGLQVRVVSGSHETMFIEENARELAKQLRTVIEETTQDLRTEQVAPNRLQGKAHEQPASPSLAPTTGHLSVVIVSWNTRKLLRQCLLSLEPQLLPDTDEVWVVDNASTDGSAAMIQERFPWVQLLRNSKNRGFARANNQAIARAGGRYILLLNPDTVVQPGALERLVHFLEDHPQVSVVGPRVLNPDGSLQLSCYPIPTLPGEIWRLFHLDRLRAYGSYDMTSWDLSAAREVGAVLGACLMVRRSALDTVGLLDPAYYMYSEEIDLCHRIGQAGWDVCWVPEASIIHWGGQSTGQASQAMFQQLFKSKVLFFRKNYGPPAARAYKLILLATSAARLLFIPLALLERNPQRQDHLALARNYCRLLWSLPRF